jgi:hypothetical protein
LTRIPNPPNPGLNTVDAINLSEEKKMIFFAVQFLYVFSSLPQANSLGKNILKLGKCENNNFVLSERPRVNFINFICASFWQVD